MLEKMESLEDVIAYCHHHEGQISAWWGEQHRLNEIQETRFLAVESRITAVEKRMVWVAGFAAGLGSIIGTTLQRVF